MARTEGDSRARGEPLADARAASSATRAAPSVRAGAALIAGAGALAHASGFRGVFVFDDLANIAENPYLTPLWPPGGWLWARPHHGLAGRPLASFSFALNRALGGLDPAGYHALNLAIHLAAALVLFGLVRRALELAGESRRALPVATASALVWVVHPLTTAAVTYVYQRCESLMSLCLLATLHLALLARARAAQGHPSRLPALGAVAACYAGTGAKETIVVAPLLALLFDRALVAGSLRAALRAAPWLYAGLFSSWIAIAALVIASGGRPNSVGFGFEGLGWWDYLRAQGPGIARYARLALWPDELVFDYGTPALASARAWLPQALAVLLALGITLFGLARNRRSALLGAAWFLILAPSSSVLPIVTEVWVEHRAYLPLAALLAAAVLVLEGLLGNGAAGRALLAVVVAALGARTHLRNRDYHGEERLWRTTIAQRPDNARAHYALGDALRKAGQREQALAEFEQAVRLDPADPYYRIYPGKLELELGRPVAARAHFEEALRLRPDWSLAHENLGMARLESGELDSAGSAFERALELAPDNLDAGRGLGMTRARQGRTREALSIFERVLSARPDDVVALVEVGELLLAPGRLYDPSRALELARRARSLSGDARVIAVLERALAAVGSASSSR
jgi:tetratricopeptide (TPR) repeat protein